MKKFLLGVIVLSFFACQNETSFRIIPFPENQHYNFPRLVAGSESWLAYPQEDKVLLFSSLDFGSAADTITVTDSIWDYCMNLWQNQLKEDGEDVFELTFPTGIMAERFAKIGVERMSVFGDSLLFCKLKLCYMIKSSVRDGLFAIYPLVCYDLKTRAFRPDYSVLNVYEYKENPHPREIAITIPIVYRVDGFHYLAYRYAYESSGKSLSFSNDIELVSFKDNKVEHICKADTFPQIIVYDVERDEILVGVWNQMHRFDSNGKLLEKLETGLKPRIAITDYLITDKGTYYLVYEKRSDWHVEVYKKGVKEPIFSAPYESASYNFQYWNGHHYFFYDQDAVTYAIEFD